MVNLGSKKQRTYRTQENSLTQLTKDMFAGRGDIEDAFFSMKDVGKAIGKLNKKQR